MAVSMRLEFQVTDGPSGEVPTVGDLRQWLATADAHGASDSDPLLQMLDERDDLEGFYTFVFPEHSK